MVIIKNLSFSYSSSKTILDNISYSFKENNIYGMIGANGAGKTTFFRLLLNSLISNNPNSISVNNILVSNNKEYRKMIAFSIDEPQFLPYITGMEWLQLVVASYGKKVDKKRLQELVDLFSFSEIEKKTMGYSHGMNKKLSMIINIMTDSSCLLFDESFAGIDPFIATSIYDYLNSLKKDKVIIISSHNKDLADSLFDTIIYLKKGKFKEIEKFENIFD